MQQPHDKVLSAVLADMNSPVLNTKRRYVRHEADSLILFVAQIYAPDEVPFLASFFPVRCKDLSCGGISFFVPAKPCFKRAVVQLGDRLNGIYMESKVMHVSPARDLPAEKLAWDSRGMEYELELGSRPFQVGCQFLKRVKAPTR